MVNWIGLVNLERFWLLLGCFVRGFCRVYEDRVFYVISEVLFVGFRGIFRGESREGLFIVFFLWVELEWIGMVLDVRVLGLGVFLF